MLCVERATTHGLVGAPGVSHSVQRYKKKKKPEELRLRAATVDLSRLYPRYGYRRTAVLLQVDGWRVSHKRVARISSLGRSSGSAAGGEA